MARSASASAICRSRLRSEAISAALVNPPSGESTTSAIDRREKNWATAGAGLRFSGPSSSPGIASGSSGSSGPSGPSGTGLGPPAPATGDATSAASCSSHGSGSASRLLSSQLLLSHPMAANLLGGSETRVASTSFEDAQPIDSGCRESMPCLHRSPRCRGVGTAAESQNYQFVIEMQSRQVSSVQHYNSFPTCTGRSVTLTIWTPRSNTHNTDTRLPHLMRR